MQTWQDILIDNLSKINIDISDKQIAMFEKYMELLLDWNNKINLTAIIEPKEIAVKHFYDSLTLSWCYDFSQPVNMIDIGTGAGFPSIPLLIIYPHINITMLDSLNKRLIFLEEVLQSLDLTANLIHARAEDKAKLPQFREQFDLVTARAVANMNRLSEYCLPYAKIDGCFAAMKGSHAQEELNEADKAISILGGKVENIKTFNLPDESERSIIIIKKVSSTPAKYPRNSGKINKIPLK